MPSRTRIESSIIFFLGGGLAAAVLFYFLMLILKPQFLESAMKTLVSPVSRVVFFSLV